jgi:hypothetical protein
MFEEIVGSHHITEMKISEGKNEAEPALKRWIDAFEETSSVELELPGSNSVIMLNQEIYIRNKWK